MKKLEKQYDVGVLVARFQVPELHQGHTDILQYMRANHKKIIVLLGVSQVSNTINNPLDYQSRVQMVNELYPEILCLPIFDEGSDEHWSQELDRKIEIICSPTQSVVLYGGRDSFIPHYHGKYDVCEMTQEYYKSGTEVRDLVRQECIGSVDFRSGVIWASANRYPATIPTVDIALTDGNRVLLGRKHHQELWKFPGGFAEPNSYSYEDDAYRELREETNMTTNFPLKYIGSYAIDDPRYTNEADKIRTILYTGVAAMGKPVAGDDLNEVLWHYIDELKEEVFVPEHRVLYKAFVDYWKDH